MLVVKTIALVACFGSQADTDGWRKVRLEDFNEAVDKNEAVKSMAEV